MCSMYKLENMSKRSRSGPSSCSPSRSGPSSCSPSRSGPSSRSPSRSGPSSRLRSTKDLITPDVLSILQLIKNNPNLRERYQNEDSRNKYIFKALSDVLDELSEDSTLTDIFKKLNEKLFPPEHVKRAAAVKAAEKRQREEQEEVNKRYGSKRAGRRRTQKRPTARRRRSSKARTTRRK